MQHALDYSLGRTLSVIMRMFEDILQKKTMENSRCNVILVYSIPLSEMVANYELRVN